MKLSEIKFSGNNTSNKCMIIMDMMIIIMIKIDLLLAVIISNVLFVCFFTLQWQASAICFRIAHLIAIENVYL